MKRSLSCLLVVVALVLVSCGGSDGGGTPSIDAVVEGKGPAFDMSSGENTAKEANLMVDIVMSSMSSAKYSPISTTPKASNGVYRSQEQDICELGKYSRTRGPNELKSEKGGNLLYNSIFNATKIGDDEVDYLEQETAEFKDFALVEDVIVENAYDKRDTGIIISGNVSGTFKTKFTPGYSKICNYIKDNTDKPLDYDLYGTMSREYEALYSGSLTVSGKYGAAVVYKIDVKRPSYIPYGSVPDYVVTGEVQIKSAGKTSECSFNWNKAKDRPNVTCKSGS